MRPVVFVTTTVAFDSIIIALVSGPLAVLFGLLLDVFRDHMSINLLTLITLPLTIPFVGLFGGIVFWHVTLPFGVITACSLWVFRSPLKKPTPRLRMVAVIVGLIYGLASFRLLPAPVVDPGLSATLLYSASVGSFVGICLPWPWLKSWKHGSNVGKNHSDKPF